MFVFSYYLFLFQEMDDFILRRMFPILTQHPSCGPDRYSVKASDEDIMKNQPNLWKENIISFYLKTRILICHFYQKLKLRVAIRSLRRIAETRSSLPLQLYEL